jgi:hypothetical protein
MCGKSCSFKGLAILLRNKLDLFVYGFKPAIILDFVLIRLRSVASVVEAFATKTGLPREFWSR